MKLLRKAAAILLLALTFGLSIAAISTVNHRILFGSEGRPGISDELLLSLIGKSGEAASGGSGGPPENSGPALKEQPVRLSVTVQDDASGSLQIVRGAAVNVSIVSPSTQAEVQRGGSAFTGQSGRVTMVAWGHTGSSGSVNFELYPGNYTVFAGHFGLVGNSSVTLIASRPETILRWAFHQRLEEPSVIQLNDDSANGLISPGETISLLCKSSISGIPQRATLTISGNQQVSVDLEVLSANSFDGEVYLVVTPLEAFAIGGLGSDSALHIGIIWWEASMTP